MDLPEPKSLELELTGGWLTVWFNNPEARNPLTDARASEITALCTALARRSDVRGVTFRGRGGHFCAGGDLKSFHKQFQSALQGGSRDDVKALSKGAADMFDAVNNLPQVTIMAIEGAAVAGGFGLACCGDVVIVDEGAQFAFTEARIGLSPAQIAPFVVNRLGRRVARMLLLTGASFKGIDAEAYGIADFVTSGDEEMAAHIASVKKSVLACAPGAVADTKRLILALPGLDRPGQVDLAAEVFADRMLSDEGLEGVSSFIEKRKPKWAI
ncbi:MAG: enoyl-CoA hydratase/isomerase family protein [Pikeienuella sp.]